jgi:transposase
MSFTSVCLGGMISGMHLTNEDRVGLESLLRRDGYDGSVSARAQIVLWRAEGHSAPEIARMAGTTKPTVYKWIARFEEYGVEGLSDWVSTGRPREISAETRGRILALSRQSPPEETGLSHWSSREMARYLKRAEGISVSHTFVSELWREHDLQPHRQGTFKLSTDPAFEEKVIDVIGLYLDPPMDAVVLSLDEKTQIQALDRTQPLLPMTFSKTEKRTHDYVRHGTTNLFAALNTATGEVLGRCFTRRRTKEFLKFMDQVVAAHDGREIHVVLDNLSTHSGPDVDTWLTKHPNVTFHFTPTGSSWLNQVETWFGIITRQAIRRGTFGSVRQLINTINAYIANWNQDSKPFTWTVTANEIITKVRLVHQDFNKLLDNNRNSQ